MRTLFVVCAALLLPAQAFAIGVWRGPYLNDITQDEVTVVWETPTAATAVVRYGVSAVDENIVNVTAAAQHQSVRLTGLSGLVSAGGEILYEVEVGGDVRTGTFTTAVAPGAPFAFLVYGDNRSSVPQHTAVVDAVLSEPVPLRFVVASGDMVSDGQNEDHWDSYFEVEAPLLAQLPIYTVIGNHEVDGVSDWDVTERIFEQPTDVPPASDTENYYHVVYGNVELIVLDGHASTLYRLGGITWPGGQEEWLEDVLDNPPAGVQHRFVVIHSGPYSSKTGRMGNYWLRFWLDDFRSAGINAIFSGHDHYAERGWAGNGLLYFIHGGGGAPLYDTEGPRRTLDHTIVHSESQLGYLLVEIDGPTAELTIKTIDGAVVDYVSYGDPINNECVVDNDCTLVTEPEFMCNDGSLECINGLCSPTCPNDLGEVVGCLSDDECESDLGSSCPGTAYCDKPEEWEFWTWHCRCDSSECSGALDCVGREPPVPGCVGTWDCVDEGVCEFNPTNGICTELVADDGAPDGGVGDPGAGDPATAGDPAAGDPATDVPTAAAPEDGCECSGVGSALPLSLLVLLRRRRRR